MTEARKEVNQRQAHYGSSQVDSLLNEKMMTASNEQVMIAFSEQVLESGNRSTCTCGEWTVWPKKAASTEES